jgi:hypothetical protein
MDIKAKIEEIVAKIKGDKNLLANFKNDPVKTVEGLIGVDLPDDIVEKIVEGVKGKITVDKAKDVLGSIKGLFGK